MIVWWTRAGSNLQQLFSLCTPFFEAQDWLIFDLHGCTREGFEPSNTQTHMYLMLLKRLSHFYSFRVGVQSNCIIWSTQQENSTDADLCYFPDLNWLTLAMKTLVMVGGCWTPLMNRQELPQLVSACLSWMLPHNFSNLFDPSLPRALLLLIR